MPQSGYPESTFHHLDRFTAGWFEHLLLDTWIPAVPHVKARLEAGITVAADPRGLLRAIRTALRPGGTYLCLEINCSDRLEENAGPLAALLYGASVLYCMTTSLGHGGEGLGTMGLPPRTLEALAREAGFSSPRRLPLENPFNNLFEIRP